MKTLAFGVILAGSLLCAHTLGNFRTRLQSRDCGDPPPPEFDEIRAIRLEGGRWPTARLGWRVVYEWPFTYHSEPICTAQEAGRYLELQVFSNNIWITLDAADLSTLGTRGPFLMRQEGPWLKLARAGVEPVWSSHWVGRDSIRCEAGMEPYQGVACVEPCAQNSVRVGAGCECVEGFVSLGATQPPCLPEDRRFRDADAVTSDGDSYLAAFGSADHGHVTVMRVDADAHPVQLGETGIGSALDIAATHTHIAVLGPSALEVLGPTGARVARLDVIIPSEIWAEEDLLFWRNETGEVRELARPVSSPSRASRVRTDVGSRVASNGVSNCTVTQPGSLVCDNGVRSTLLHGSGIAQACGVFATLNRHSSTVVIDYLTVVDDAVRIFSLPLGNFNVEHDYLNAQVAAMTQTSTLVRFGTRFVRFPNPRAILAVCDGGTMPTAPLTDPLGNPITP